MLLGNTITEIRKAGKLPGLLRFFSLICGALPGSELLYHLLHRLQHYWPCLSLFEGDYVPGLVGL